MAQNSYVYSWRFWLVWALAFLGFPIGGLLANLVVGPVITPVQAGIAGAITGAVLGAAQWLVLKGRIPVSFWWIIATSAGLALGLALSVALLGSEVSGDVLFGRAAITGFWVGAAQWFLLQQKLAGSAIWIVVVGLGWVIGWIMTRGAGIDLSLKWSVFGAAGAITFQVLTGLALYFMFRLSKGVK
jgi:hypothetical protein